MQKKVAYLEHGFISFSIESRFVRELGERLVKQPEIALQELLKNAYDADALSCLIQVGFPDWILVVDDGKGMTFEEFRDGWMRIGTSAKDNKKFSNKFRRRITGEKGIGRFAVRFLGRKLRLESVAWDPRHKFKTKLMATFDWPQFDHSEDLGKITIPYTVEKASVDDKEGTRLEISDLRPIVGNLDYKSIKSASISVTSPHRSLLNEDFIDDSNKSTYNAKEEDPGFTLSIVEGKGDPAGEGDIASEVLDNYVLKSILELKDDRVILEVYQKGSEEPVLKVSDGIINLIGPMRADIRFFPKRKGTFSAFGVNGFKAANWVMENSGVCVYDRHFRVHPYGEEGDDWLRISADKSKNFRNPRSALAKKFFPMDAETRLSTQLNYMLRLPHLNQMVGVVQIEGRRSQEQLDGDEGLVATADREGFLDNPAFKQLQDLIRGAIEAIAYQDRELQQELLRNENQVRLGRLEEETRKAIQEIESSVNLPKHEKARIVLRLTKTQEIAQDQEKAHFQRESTLNIMSMLGVVAGFMTHEFGTAVSTLEEALAKINIILPQNKDLKGIAVFLEKSIIDLKDLVTYSQGYIRGASTIPHGAFPAKPRILQVQRVFGKYATDRGIKVVIDVESGLLAPLVPVALYNGLALNLYTNALKAITMKTTGGERIISFRAWNEKDTHFLQVSDTGIGVSPSMRDRIFDPLFTTTSLNKDPIGAGMGLGLSLVKRCAEEFGGGVSVVDPPPGFITCFRVHLPMSGRKK